MPVAVTPVAAAPATHFAEQVSGHRLGDAAERAGLKGARRSSSREGYPAKDKEGNGNKQFPHKLSPHSSSESVAMIH